MSIDIARFEQAKVTVLTGRHDPHGFGTLQEKTLHAVMKRYYAPDTDQHEIPLEGYIADVYNASTESVIEIQNGNFGKMRDKLKAFLPLYDVTVVYPIPEKRQLYWVDDKTGAVTKGGMSKRKDSFYTVVPELYQIRQYIADAHFHLRIPVLSMDEYRLLNGWSKDRKRGSVRYDRVPREFVSEYVLDRIEDYVQFIPMELEEEFVSSEFAKCTKTDAQTASYVLRFFYEIGILERIGKRGRSYLYHISEQYR